jgi:hypothetical protein
MSYPIQFPISRAFAPALLALAAIAAPAATTQAQSITSERALLNPVPVAYRVVVVGAGSPIAGVDGERALLGRWTAGASATPSLAVASEGEWRVIDGEQALVGRRVAPFDRRRVAQAR